MSITCKSVTRHRYGSNGRASRVKVVQEERAFPRTDFEVLVDRLLATPPGSAAARSVLDELVGRREGGAACRQ